DYEVRTARIALEQWARKQERHALEVLNQPGAIAIRARRYEHAQILDDRIAPRERLRSLAVGITPALTSARESVDREAVIHAASEVIWCALSQAIAGSMTWREYRESHSLGDHDTPDVWEIANWVDVLSTQLESLTEYDPL